MWHPATKAFCVSRDSFYIMDFRLVTLKIIHSYCIDSIGEILIARLAGIIDIIIDNIIEIIPVITT